MRILVKTLGNLYKVNPDQLAAFAVEYAENYDTLGEGVDFATVDEDFAYTLIKDFQADNKKGHDWRAETVQESMNEAMDFERGQDPKKTIGIGIHTLIRNKVKEMNRRTKKLIKIYKK